MLNCSLRHIKKLLRVVKDYDLSVSASFDKKTPQWMKRHYNGIGAEWMPKRVRALTTRMLRKLEPVALVHDIEFLETPKNYWRFTVANMRFAYNAAKLKRFFVGAACAVVCQLFGWRAYADGKESMAYCNFYCEDKEWNTSKR